MNVFPSGLDVRTFDEAWSTALHYIGMGGITVTWNPYQHLWIVRIDFSDGEKYQSTHADINVALRHCRRLVDEVPPKLHTETIKRREADENS